MPSHTATTPTPNISRTLMVISTQPIALAPQNNSSGLGSKISKASFGADEKNHLFVPSY